MRSIDVEIGEDVDLISRSPGAAVGEQEGAGNRAYLPGLSLSSYPGSSVLPPSHLLTTRARDIQHMTST